MVKTKLAFSSGTSKHRSFKKRRVFIGVVFIVGVVVVLELTNTTRFFHKSVPATQVIVRAGKVEPAPKNNISTSSNTKKTSTSGNLVAGGGTDTNGSASSSTNSSQWIISKSGNITVKQPVADARLQSGSVLSGSANVDSVNFRLIDNQVGVISEGTLNVVNGNFSGTLNFTPHSSSGRLDVFSTNSQGIELNEVQISVSF